MSLQPSERAELRGGGSGFKDSAVAGEERRLQRERITVEIRKASRVNVLRKRRRATAGPAGAETEADPHAPLALDAIRAALPLWVQRLRSNDSHTQLEAARVFGKLLSII